MRALDYLETRKEVDPKRIGVTGRSGGGATSWWIAAADERPQCIIPVAGIADLRAHLVEGVAPRFRKGVISGHCDCMYMVNTYRWDFSVVAALCAPRPLMLGNSDKDDIFPVPGYRRLAEDVRKIYKLYDASDKFVLLETAGPHKDTPELRLGAFRWLNRWLKHDLGEVTEEKRPLWTAQQLKVFDRLPEDACNALVHEVFIKPARPEQPLSAEVAKAWWPGKRQEWMKALKEQVFRGWAANPPPLNARLAADVNKAGVRLRAFDYPSEEGVELRWWLLTATQNLKPSLTVVQSVDEPGWQQWVAELDPAFREALQLTHEPKFDPQGLARIRRVLEITKWALATVAPRGIGPTRWKEAGTPAENPVKRRFALIGQTLDGQRVWDVRRGLAALRQVPDLKGGKFWLQGEGVMAGIVLYAALFEPDVTRLQLRQLPASHVQGPTFLNVRRYFDTPQALALALPRSIDLTVAPGELTQFNWALQLQSSLGATSLKIRAYNQLNKGLLLPILPRNQIRSSWRRGMYPGIPCRIVFLTKESDSMADEMTPPVAPEQVAQPQFPTDYSALSTVYTNFCRVSVTPEELILDFGLNTQVVPNPSEPIKLSHRVVMNFYTAKRLMTALMSVVNQHENAYGVLELDFQRRARSMQRPQGAR